MLETTLFSIKSWKQILWSPAYAVIIMQYTNVSQCNKHDSSRVDIHRYLYSLQYSATISNCTVTVCDIRLMGVNLTVLGLTNTWFHFTFYCCVVMDFCIESIWNLSCFYYSVIFIHKLDYKNVYVIWLQIFWATPLLNITKIGQLLTK